jgi:5-enolpyruvylshikimate-3-phosphate synthase
MAERLIIAPPQGPLSGSISLPGDKSVTHRALMLGLVRVVVERRTRPVHGGSP